MISLPNWPSATAPQSNYQVPISIRFVVGVWCFLLPLSGISGASGGSFSDLFLIAAAALCALTAISRIHALHFKRLLVTAALTLHLCTFVIIASTVNSTSPSQSLSIALQLSLAYLCVILIVSVLCTSPASIQIALMSYVAGCVILTISTWLTSSPLYGDRSVGLAGNPVEVGNSVGVALAVVATWRTTLLRYLVLRFVVALVLASAFISSVTLTGLVSFITACTIIMILQPDSRAVSLLGFYSFVGFSAGIAWLAGFGGELVEKLDRTLNPSSSLSSTSSDGTSTVDGRIETIRVAIKRIADHPILGNGLDVEGMASYGRLGAHNSLVLAWQSGGVVLAILVAVILALSIKAVVHLYRSSSFSDGWVCAVAAASLCAWINGLTGPNLYQRSWLFPVFLLIAVTGYRKTARSRPAISPSMGYLPSKEAHQ